MIQRVFAAAIVAAAVLLGSMVAADRGAAGSPGSPQTIDWQTIAADGPADAGPVGEWSSDPVGTDPNSTDKTNGTNSAALPPAAEVPLGSFRPSPPLADSRTLAAKIEALEVRVATLESARVVSTPTQTARIVTQPVIVSPQSAPTMVCAGGVCRVASGSARVANYPTRRFFRRW